MESHTGKLGSYEQRLNTLNSISFLKGESKKKKVKISDLFGFLRDYIAMFGSPELLLWIKQTK